ncbi:hypothetical protein ABH968_003420 [Lysinibacillus sp. RC79]
MTKGIWSSHIPNVFFVRTSLARGDDCAQLA